VADHIDFDSFVERRSPALVRTAYLLTRDHDLAEDLVQTTLVKAWGAWKRIDDDPEPYVRKIMVNTYTGWWRRRWRGEVPTAELPDADHTGDETRTVDDRTVLWAALARLTRRQRAVIVLRYFEDLPEAVVADLLGCSVGTVKSQTSKALAKLRIDTSLTGLSLHTMERN
jgi:RNA polymerase sigma-70 factor (sigma-E family)